MNDMDADDQPQSGRLAQLAQEHQKFLKKRRQATGLGISYPTTRSTSEVMSGAKSPSVQAGITNFLGMGSKTGGD